MATWHGYIAVENLNLGDANWTRLKQLFAGWGPLSDPSPARLFHKRFSLDGTIGIAEAAFNTDDISIAGFRQALANEFGIDAGDIGVVANGVTFAVLPTPFWTFSYPGGVTNRFRAGVFGGLSSTWEQSRLEVVAYLLANLGEWEAGE